MINISSSLRCKKEKNEETGTNLEAILSIKDLLGVTTTFENVVALGIDEHWRAESSMWSTAICFYCLSNPNSEQFPFILFVLSCFCCCCCFVWFWLLLFWVVDLKHFFITLVSVAVTHHGFCFSPWNRSVFLWPVFTNQHTPLQLAASATLSFRFHVSFRTVTATAPLRPPHSKLPLVIFSTGYQS